MLPTLPLARGAVVLANFPFTDRPKLPGRLPHYCLVAATATLQDLRMVAVAYGTSRLDEELMRAHAGAILSVPSQLIKGATMPGPVTHFVMDHVAVMPIHEAWVHPVTARLDCFKAHHAQDPYRRQLLANFARMEHVLGDAAVKALSEQARTRQFGLPGGAKLRAE